MGADELRSRLRRLRRDPVAGERERQDDPGLPDWFRARAARRAGNRTENARVPAGSFGPPRDLREEGGERGTFAFRSTRLEGGATHGALALEQVGAARRGTLALVARDERLARIDPLRAVYLDTETTGLSGGAGVHVWMVGLGSFDGGAFELWQGFLRSPAEEAALLSEVARRVRAADALVSFFGKSFDRHRLEDKMLVHGIEPPFAGVPHLDLYHACQRLYGGTLPDGRLRTMESRLTGVERDDDLPGSQAPAAWFDYLAGRAHRVEDVFRHNRDDVLSLVVLAAHVGQAQEPGDLLGGAGARAAGLARLHAGEGRLEEALAWSERALAAPDLTVGRAVAHLRAELLRRLARPREARAAYVDVARDTEDALAARCWIEVAKLDEHRLGDPDGALEACAQAARRVERSCTGALRVRLERDLERRLRRLRRPGSPAR